MVQCGAAMSRLLALRAMPPRTATGTASKRQEYGRLGIQVSFNPSLEGFQKAANILTLACGKESSRGPERYDFSGTAF